jgi:hypothetical protein
MKKNKFLALTMLCSAFCEIPAKAQEIKDSTSQKIGGVENSSNNEGNKNLKENEDLEKNKNLEEKSKTRNKKGKISRFVDLVIDHPILSTIIGVSSVLAEEGIRRKFFPGKWGVDKFGYNEEEKCIYKNPKGKINVVILGPKEYREKFIKILKDDEEYRNYYKKDLHNAKYPYLELTEERTEFKNWNIIQKDFDFDKEPSKKFKDKLNKDLKNDVAALIIVHKNDCQQLGGIGGSVENIKCGDKEFSSTKGLNICRIYFHKV